MKIFLFYFEMAIKITGSAQNYRVGRVSGNTPIFLGLKYGTNVKTFFYHLCKRKSACASHNLISAFIIVIALSRLCLFLSQTPKTVNTFT